MITTSPTTSNTPARRLGRLATGLVAASLAVGSLAVATAAPAHALSGCELDCISSAKVTQFLADKGQIIVELTTTVPANVKVQVSDAYGNVVSTMSETVGKLGTFHYLVSPYVMTQGRGHVVRMTATDASGKSYTELKGLTALQRTVTVKLSKISISEDSDNGAGELAAGLKVGGTVGTIFGRRSITAPFAKAYTTTVVAKFAPEKTPILVEINDDDCEGFCSGGTGFSFTSGSNSDWDWTTAAATASKDHVAGTITKSFSASANGALEFLVTGSFTVTIS